MILRKLFELGYKSKLNGEKIDTLLQTALGNFISDEPYHIIELQNIDELVIMLNSATKYFNLIDSNMNFCAFYDYDSTYPLPRIYKLTENPFTTGYDVFKNLQLNGFDLHMIHGASFVEEYQKSDFKNRVKKYLNEQHERTYSFKELAQGRLSVTVIDNVHFYNTDTCLLCKKPKNNLMTSSFLGDSGLMIGFYLCNSHYNKSLRFKSSFEFLCNEFGIQSPYIYNSLSLYDILEETKQMLISELNPKIIISRIERKNNKKKDLTKQFVITCEMTNGFSVKIRYESSFNYGYVILDSNNKQVIRYDSANHHKLNFSPHHVHPDPLQNNKNAKPSYLFGLPIFDIIGLKKVLLTEEEKS